MANLPRLPIFAETDFPHRSRPAQYRRELGVSRGWYQDGRKLYNVKPSKAFIWPKDGKRGGTWGRVKDILSGQGPDIFVTFGAKKSDCVFNRPTRAQWAGHVPLDDFGLIKGFDHEKFAPWTVKGPRGRVPRLCYDFRTRKYVVENPSMWTDAIWQLEPCKNRRDNPYPEAVRDWSGEWYQDAYYLPHVIGGPVSNDAGRGVLGCYL